MPEYVKICPECQHSNAESENTCEQCHAFIGLEDSILKAVEVDKHSEVYCHLVLSGARRFIVTHQAVLGQEHPSAIVQIPLADIEGVRYIHRQHCRFEFLAPQWHVIAINQQPLGHQFTNPSWLNEKKIPLESPIPLKHADQLKLSGLLFTMDMGNTHILSKEKN